MQDWSRVFGKTGRELVKRGSSIDGHSFVLIEYLADFEDDCCFPSALRAKLVEVLGEGIALILSRWSTLQLAVENEFDGPGSRSKAEKLYSDIFFWFKIPEEPLDIDDLVSILDEVMDSLNIDFEDGSEEIKEVAHKLMSMREECLEGNYTSIEKMRQLIPRRVNHQHIRQVINDEEEEEEDDKDRMEVDDRTNIMVDSAEFQSSSRVEIPINGAESKEMAQAEDGWVVVSSGRNRGKRN